MPKLKTNSSAKKRFKPAANGRFKHRCAERNHILTKKTTKRKRNLRGMKLLSDSDTNLVKNMLRRMIKKRK